MKQRNLNQNNLLRERERERERERREREREREREKIDGFMPSSRAFARREAQGY